MKWREHITRERAIGAIYGITLALAVIGFLLLLDL
jgi:hypothetical protein